MESGKKEDQPVGRFAAGLVVERRWRSDNGGSGGTLVASALKWGRKAYSASARGAQKRRKKERAGAEREKRAGIGEREEQR